jgi:hypothetical protein
VKIRTQGGAESFYVCYISHTQALTVNEGLRSLHAASPIRGSAVVLKYNARKQKYDRLRGQEHPKALLSLQRLVVVAWFLIYGADCHCRVLQEVQERPRTAIHHHGRLEVPPSLSVVGV